MTSTTRVAHLIPDPYCLMTGGYRTCASTCNEIRYRHGMNACNAGILARLNNRQQKHRSEHPGAQPSLPIGSFESTWPDRLDARINRAVQCRDAQAREQVEHRLQQEGLLSAR